MPITEVVRVFVDDVDDLGNLLTVVRESSHLTDTECAQIARSAGTSETVFVDDPVGAHVRIYVPAGPIPFAGYPVVGTGWLLSRRGFAAKQISTATASSRICPTDDGCHWPAESQERNTSMNRSTGGSALPRRR